MPVSATVSLSVLLAAGAASASDATGWRSAFDQRYDAVILGTGLKESLLAGLLATRGKRVLHLDRDAQYGGSAASLDLAQLFERLGGPDEQPNEKKLGASDSYRIDLAPKVVMAHGTELQLLVQSGAWKHMDWKRVQRSLIYRKAADGKPDVHRVLATVEDVLKTRMLSPMQKSAMVRLFTWLERYKEDDPDTHATGLMSKTKLDLRRMSAAAFLRFWEVPRRTGQSGRPSAGRAAPPRPAAASRDGGRRPGAARRSRKGRPRRAAPRLGSRRRRREAAPSP